MSLQVLPQASKVLKPLILVGEVDGFSKTLSSLDISIQTSDLSSSFVLALVLGGSRYGVILFQEFPQGKQPKEFTDSEYQILATYSPQMGYNIGSIFIYFILIILFENLFKPRQFALLWYGY